MSNSKTADLARQERQKERGLWNFLTWSFFLAQFVSGEPFAAAAAASRVNAEEMSEQAGPGTQGFARLPMDSAVGSNVTDETGQAGAQPYSAAAAAQLAMAGVHPHDPSAFAAAKIANHGDAWHPAQMGSSVAWHGGSNDGDNVAPPETNDPSTGDSGIHLPDILSPIGSGVVDLIDDLLDPPLSAIGGTVGDLTDCLTETIDDVMASLDTTLNLIGHATSALTPVLNNTLTNVAASASQVVKDVTAPVTATVATVTDGLSDGIEKLTDGGLVGGVVSSAGQIVFKPLSLGGDLPLDLFSGGKYTDYNLTLRAEHGPDTQGNASAATTNSSTLLDKLLAPDVSDPSHGDGDKLAALTPAHVIEEIGLKGLSDSLLSH